MSKHKILLVEDDIDLGNVLKQYMEFSDYKVVLCRNGKQGLEAFRSNNFDLCILDIMMPSLDGYSLAAEIKKLDKDIPFVFLTAKSGKPDRLKGLEMGADDYVCKPFEADELLLRVRNILRRTGKIQGEPVCIGSYKFDFEDLSLCRGPEKKRLTLREAELLKMLFDNRNSLVERSELLKRLWGEDDYFLGRSMDVFISRLRKCLKDDDRVAIENVRGMGFILKIHE